MNKKRLMYRTLVFFRSPGLVLASVYAEKEQSCSLASSSGRRPVPAVAGSLARHEGNATSAERLFIKIFLIASLSALLSALPYLLFNHVCIVSAFILSGLARIVPVYVLNNTVKQSTNDSISVGGLRIFPLLERQKPVYDRIEKIIRTKQCFF
jgi:hypothetical protein